MTAVSIIIVNYNTKKLLRDCLASLYEQTKDLAFEIIVSDNGSTDGSIDMLRTEFPQVILLENNGNLGFGRANNRGAERASGEYLFFLNSDTVVKNNAAALFYHCAKEMNFALLGCLLKDGEGGWNQSFEKYSTPLKSLLRIVYLSFPGVHRLKQSFIKSSGYKNEAGDRSLGHFMVDWIIGADIFIKASLFRELNGFDTNFFMYFEDDDLCRRAKALGVDSYIIPGPEIVHFEGGSSEINARIIKIREQSYLHYMAKHHSKITYGIIKGIFLLYVFMRSFKKEFRG